MKSGVKSRLVKVSDSAIRVRVSNDLEADDDDLHGFISRRSVFRRTCDEDSYKDTQWGRIKGILQDSHQRNEFCDLSLVVNDGIIQLSRLVTILILPTLLQCGSQDDVEVILLPDYSKQEIEDLLQTLFGEVDSVPSNSDIKCDSDADIQISSCDQEKVSQGDKEKEAPEPLPEVFSCQVCSRTFGNLYLLVSHEVEAHSTKGETNAEFDPVTCFRCGEGMTRGFQISNHKCSLTKYNPTRSRGNILRKTQAFEQKILKIY